MKYFSIIITGLILIESCTDNKQEGNMQNTGERMEKHYEAPEWAYNSILYECNVRQFSAEGNLAGVTKQLPRIKELGVDVL